MKTLHSNCALEARRRGWAWALVLGWCVPLTSSAVVWVSTPPHGWTDWPTETRLRWSWFAQVQGPVTYQVYFGTNPVPGPAELLGSTTNKSWPLPRLAPATTYYWQIVSDNPVLGASPVWQFTTRGLHHFEWEVPAGTQFVGRPFPVRVRAVDEFGQTVSNYTGLATVTAFTNWVRILFQEDFEDGNAEGWQTCPVDPDEWDTYWQEYTLSVTNVPGCGGQYCLSIVGDTWECGHGVWRRVFPAPTLPERVTFRIRASATNATGGTVRLVDDEPIFFQLRNDGTMGPSWTHVSPPLSYQAGQWYKITLVYKPELVQRERWEDPLCVIYWWEHLVWIDFYVDDRLVAAGIPLYLDGPAALTFFSVVNKHPTEVWLDDIEFRAPPVAIPIPIQPVAPVQFTNGVWAGQVIVQQPAQELYLKADDGQQHLGTNDPIALLAGAPFRINRVAVTDGRFHLEWEGGTGRYQVQQTANVVAGRWEPVGEPITNTSLTVPMDRAAPARFFRVQSLPDGS